MKLITPRDGAETWTPNMSPPASFTEKDQLAYQKHIDGIVGTRDGRPIVKLAWAPSELRWRPHAMGTEQQGYTFPIFFAYWDKGGNEVAAPRWVLLQRLEPEQFAPLWEASRYSRHEGQVWDWKGPCPSEKYTELRCHSYHDGMCCPCLGESCTCGTQYAHCWGNYADPNERLLDWIRKTAYEARQDPDVNPTRDIREFNTPESQRQVKNEMINLQEKKKEEDMRFAAHMLSHWERKPHSVHLLN